MITFFTSTLFISIGALVALMTLKQIELSTGRIILAPVRPGINRFFKTCLLLVERVLPGLAKDSVLHVLSHSREAVQKLLARGILWLEVKLKYALHIIREKTHPSHARGEASAFLKEVGEYKKQLESEVEKDDHAIFDDIPKMQ